MTVWTLYDVRGFHALANQAIDLAEDIADVAMHGDWSDEQFAEFRQLERSANDIGEKLRQIAEKLVEAS